MGTPLSAAVYVVSVLTLASTCLVLTTARNVLAIAVTRRYHYWGASSAYHYIVGTPERRGRIAIDRHEEDAVRMSPKLRSEGT